MLRHVLPALLSLTLAAPCIAADDSKPELVSTTGGKSGENQWKSVEEMQKAAAAGNPVACYELGEMHLAGQQVPQDVTKAVALLEKAADAGHANAAFRLGKLHADGELVPKNIPQALARYQAAAHGGVSEAQFNLGAMYASGRGVKRDYVEGLAWLIVAAKNGAAPEGEKQLREHLTKQKRTATIADAEKRAASLLGQPAAGKAPDPSPAGAAEAPPAVRSDGKVKVGEPAAPERIKVNPPAPIGVSIPVLPPPPPAPKPASEPEAKTATPAK